jgi:hypothetical protein
MTPKEMLDDISKYMPGDLGDIAMMVPCHVQTLYNINMGKGNTRQIIVNKLGELHTKAMEIKAISES